MMSDGRWVKVDWWTGMPVETRPEVVNFKGTGEPHTSITAVREYMTKRYGGTSPAYAFWREYNPANLPQISNEYE